MTILVAIIAFIVALGLLVTIHEYGHFWVARRCGVKVLKFSVGFGRALWSRTGRDGTEYVVAAIPLGGYVKMLDERDPDTPAGDMTRSFNRARPSRKIAISLAGPAANFLFAVFAYWLMFMIGIPGLKPVVGDVAVDTPAAYAGFESGDLIVSVRGSDTPTWEAALLGLMDAVSAGEPFPVTVEDEDGHRRTLAVAAQSSRTLTEPGALLPGLGLQPWQPTLSQFPPRLGDIQPGGPAARAGLRQGDLVRAVDGQAVGNWMALVDVVRARPGAAAWFDIERDGAGTRVMVDVSTTDDGYGRIGVGVAVPEELRERMSAETRYGPFAALLHGASRTVDMSWLTLKLLGRMVTGAVSVRNISGPINIAQYAGMSASSGLVQFLSFLAIVSISLGIINLMPIPILDGGHLLYHLAELVRGRPVTVQTELMGQRVGLGMLAMLMGLAFYNDLARIFGS